MPIYSDIVDDELIFDGTPTFGGGMDGQADPSVIDATTCADLKNVDMNRFGILMTRKGTSLVGTAPFSGRIQGLSELDTPTVEQLIAVSGGNFKKYESGTWSDIVGFTADTSANIDMEQGINVLYIADGTNNLHTWDGTSFTNLGTGSPKPPICPFLCWHTSRLFAAGNSTNNDTVYVSDILDAGATGWDWTNQSFRVGGGEGDAITGIAKWVGYKLAVFKNNSFYVVEADPAESVSNWIIERISPVIGCVAHRSIKQVGNDLYFLSRDGVRSIIRTTTAALNEVSFPLSFPMQPIIDRINWTYAHLSNAVYFDNKYILSVPLDSAEYPNYCIVYDTRAQKWTGYWTGWTSQQFLISLLANGRSLYFGDNDGNVMEWNYDADSEIAASFLDNSVDIPTSIKTRAYRFNDPLRLKKGWNINMEFYQSQATASLSAILDQGGNDTIDSSFSTEQIENQLPLDLPFDLALIRNKRVAFDLYKLGEFREIQFELASSSGKLSLKTILASAFMRDIKFEINT